MLDVLKRGIEKLKEDINVIYENDPAANNILEVIFCYSGLHALIMYRLAQDFTNGIFRFYRDFFRI